MNEKSRNALVTGGAGFIGSHLVDALIERGLDVVVIDNLSTGKRENLNPKADFYELDIRDLEKIKPVFNNVDYVFHLAARPRVPFSIEFPQEAHTINALGTLNVLIASRDAKIKKFIYSSSSSVYGDQEKLPLREDMVPGPKSPYAFQKLIGEKYCQLFHQLYGLPTVSLRYFNVYGPRISFDGSYILVLGVFLQQKMRGEPLTIDGDGEQTRDFTHVKDIVRANILALESDKVGKGEVINVGAGNNHSIKKIAQLIGGGIIHRPARQGDIRHTLADNSLARELLGWSPGVKIEEGINELKGWLGLK
jgi:nucleoside-diphosphate-sugar epimerase